jgi:hypothetical protein
MAEGPADFVEKAGTVALAKLLREGADRQFRWLMPSARWRGSQNEFARVGELHIQKRQAN